VYDVALQPDGKIIIGGSFTNINGTSRNNIARLNSDGSVDLSFDPGAGTDYSVYRVIREPDGKILVAGGFESCGGAVRRYFARLNADGSLDTGFDPDLNGYPSIALQKDGRILVGGYITMVGGVPRNYLARLNPDGSLDDSFNTIAVDDYLSSVTALADGKVLIGGYFTNVNGFSRNHFARLNADGSLDLTFNPPGPDYYLSDTVHGDAAVELPNGKLLVWGNFTNFNGITRPGLVRLYSNGSVDIRFDTGTGPEGDLVSLVRQPDTRILICGGFWSFNGVPRNGVARLYGSSLPIARITVSPLAQFPGLTNLFVITPSAAKARVVLDGSESSSDEDEPLEFQWREGTNVFANAVTTTNVMRAGSHEITLTVSSDAGSNNATAMVDIITPAESVRILIGMVERSTLAPKQRLSLMATLHAAEAAFSRGSPPAGLRLLAAFQTKVEIQIARAYPALAAELMDSAQTIIDALDVRPSRSPFEKVKGAKP
jgi:uncharacterized delta-60 repeat protein